MYFSMTEFVKSATIKPKSNGDISVDFGICYIAINPNEAENLANSLLSAVKFGKENTIKLEA